MTPLQEKLLQSGQTLSEIAREIGVSLQDLSHFVRGEMDRVGRASQRKIREWMTQKRYLKPSRKRKTCICPRCHGRHVMRRNDRGSVRLVSASRQ